MLLIFHLFVSIPLFVSIFFSVSNLLSVVSPLCVSNPLSFVDLSFSLFLSNSLLILVALDSCPVETV